MLQTFVRRRRRHRLDDAMYRHMRLPARKDEVNERYAHLLQIYRYISAKEICVQIAK